MTTESPKLNVLGEPLISCSNTPLTGYFRDGMCRTDDTDRGRHIICAQMTQPFLAFTKSRGNDLSTPMPQFAFTGLKPGDRWCLCALRWQEALLAKMAPPVFLAGCEMAALNIVSLEDLMAHAIDRSQRVMH